MNIRLKVQFIGLVQGVGFRNTTKKMALELGIKGTVRNLEDGSVEAIFIGSEPIVDVLMERLQSHFKNHIQTVLVLENQTTLSQPTGFQIL